MTQPSLYVPVLRSHAAERDAVRELDPSVRRLMAPLFEVSRKSALEMEDLPAHAVARKLVQLTFGSAGQGEMYIDPTALAARNDLTAICAEIERLLLSLHSDAQFVFRLDDFGRSSGVGSARQLMERNGCAFRVITSDYSGPSLSNIASLLKKAGIDARNVDLLVDCQIVAKGERMRGTAAKLENDHAWRSITYLGGSFPPNLVQLKKNDQHELPRHEWIAFSSEGHDRRTRFGDYTVQHPLQPDPPLKTLPSGSIRYTSDDYWVVMRGEKLDNPTGPGHEQYIAQAQLLCGRPEYRGRSFSAGDEYIYVIATEMKQTGNPKTWLQAAMNHHMTLAARQISAALAA